MWKQLVTRGLAPSRQARRDRGNRTSACHLTVEALEDRRLLSGDIVLRWNNIALAAIRNASLNPLAANRTLAIVQAAVYDAINSIEPSYTPYLASIPAPSGASEDAAAAQAAHDALVGLFPTQALVLDLQLKASLQGIADGDAKTAGILVGQIAAQNLLAARANDGQDKVVDYTPGANPGDWQPTPPAYASPLAPQWPSVTPFCLQSGSQFRPPPPPALNSPEYTAAFNDVKEVGLFNSTTRTADQTEAALFWQGIVTPNSTPAGEWNLIAQQVAIAQGTTLVQNARLFALLDLAAADQAIACWDAKYTYSLWRPVTAIPAADTDGNPDSVPDATWTPLFPTPSHPSYPSGHSTVSGGSAAVLASFFGTDAIPFTLSFEGLPGVTRSFDGFKTAEVEAGMARIWAGIHYSFDISAGQALGEALGTYVVQNFLLPRGGAAAPPRAASVPVATRAVATVEDTRINVGGDPSSGLLMPTGFALEGSILPDTSGAVLRVGQPTVLPLLAVANSNLVLVDTPATEASRSEAARPQTPVSSVDDVFGSGDSWEGHLATAPWVTERM